MYFTTMGRLECVVFDLDHTLILTTDKSVRVRPYAYDLIQFCRQHWRVAVYSAGTADYIEEMLNLMGFTPDFVLDRSYMVKHPYLDRLTKRLSHLELATGISASSMIVIDDDRTNYPGKDSMHVMWCEPYLGKPDDCLAVHLQRLQRYYQSVYLTSPRDKKEPITA